MEDDEPKSEKTYPLSTAKMSKTPSWIMLGFLLGAGFVVALPPLRKKAAPEPAAFKAIEPVRSAEPREAPQLTTIEAVFTEWGKLAVWSDGVTEVAQWNSRDQAFTDFYEVRRIGSEFYFRTISQLTRRVIARGKPIPECPLQFTETEEQYQEWRQHGRTERSAERDLRPPPEPRRSNPAAPQVEGIRVAPPTFEKIGPSLEAPPAGGAPKK
jgi:hypothetical protein